MKIGLLSEPLIVEPIVELEPQAVDMSEVNAAVLDIEVAVSEGGEIQMQIETAEAAVDTLEAVAEPLEEAQEAGEEVSEAAMEALNISIKHILQSMGASKETKFIATESFRVGKNKKLALENALDTIKEWVKKIVDAIVSGFKRVVEWVVGFWNKLFATAASLEKKAEALQKKISEKSDAFVAKDKTWAASSYKQIVPATSQHEATTEYKLSKTLSDFGSKATSAQAQRNGVDKVVSDVSAVVNGLMSTGKSGKEAAAACAAAFGKVNATHDVFNTQFIIKQESGKEDHITTVVVVNDIQLAPKAEIVNDSVKVGDFKAPVDALITLAKHLVASKAEADNVKKTLDAIIKAGLEAKKQVDSEKEEGEKAAELKAKVVLLNNVASEFRKLVGRVVTAMDKTAMSAGVSFLNLASSAVGSAGKETEAKKD